MSKKSHKSFTGTAITNNGVKIAFVKLLQNAVNSPAPFSTLTPTHPKGHDPIIDEYIAFRQKHPHDPLPKSLADKMAAAFPGVDLERVGRNFVSDIIDSGVTERKAE